MRWQKVRAAWWLARRLDWLADRLRAAADWLRPPLWTPFGEDGKLRPELTRHEGWHFTGAMGDGDLTMVKPITMRDFPGQPVRLYEDEQ